MSGNTVYDYEAIAACNAEFKREIGLMHEDIDRFQGEVQKLVADTWGGTAATQYNAAADGLNKDLESRKNTLMELERRLGLSADNMQDTDRQGGKNIGASV
ncbi:WXG100 family type VII secretion target [Pseudonocardia sp. MH-G8]|uniref:WXG100 family type VII secretion target n=1 Tax=Pseudonocardia sp. MH-G8 TaxID=1854588 RepID=UPI000BA03425|nr:WXG100 family type VII secretion target [Pseudonocardia sp. MH-G8]OZM78834.1 hypothetical protein CFP66_28110 [Pseudonocardia sp. MH-G8]